MLYLYLIKPHSIFTFNPNPSLKKYNNVASTHRSHVLVGPLPPPTPKKRKTQDHMTYLLFYYYYLTLLSHENDK